MKVEKEIYTILDNGTEKCTDPFTAINEIEAKRTFMQYIARGLSGNPVFPYTDLELIKIGGWNGEFIIASAGEGKHKYIINGTEIYNELMKITQIHQQNEQEPSETEKIRMTQKNRL